MSIVTVQGIYNGGLSLTRAYYWFRHATLFGLVVFTLSCAHTPQSPLLNDVVSQGLLSVSEPSSSEPVKAVLTVARAKAIEGDVTELIICVRIAKAHYLHAASKLDVHFIPTAVYVPLPEGIEGMGDWIFPPPETLGNSSPIYRDSMVLRRAIRVSSHVAPQTLVLKGELRFQACTDELCWPPGKIELSAPLVIQAKRR